MSEYLAGVSFGWKYDLFSHIWRPYFDTLQVFLRD